MSNADSYAFEIVRKAVGEDPTAQLNYAVGRCCHQKELVAHFTSMAVTHTKSLAAALEAGEGQDVTRAILRDVSRCIRGAEDHRVHAAALLRLADQLARENHAGDPTALELVDRAR